MFKVSVIISCYRNEKDIEKAIQSCVDQTLDSLEIIVVNDGSPDNSQSIIDKMVKKHPNRVFSYIKENGGISSVRNYGVSKVRGEYFGFLDGDDYVEPDMFEKMYSCAKQNGSQMVYSGLYFTYDNHEKEFMEGPYDDSNGMMCDLYAVVWNKIYHTEWIRTLNLDFPVGKRFEDVSFLYKLAPHLERIDSVNECFIHYVQRQGSITASHNDKVKQIVSVWDDLIEYYRNHGFYSKYYQELEYCMIKFMLGQPFRSACKIQDEKDRKATLKLLWNHLNLHFPNWKNNAILKRKKDAKHLYFRCVSSITYPLFSFLFQWL